MTIQIVKLVVLLALFCQLASAYNATVTSRAGRTCTKSSGQATHCKRTPEFNSYVKELVNSMKQALKPIPAIKVPNHKLEDGVSYYSGGGGVCASISKLSSPNT